jgi:hypothetical protein
MLNPHTIRVKISSEAAESIALTPVVARDMSFSELLEQIVSVTGKDVPRIRELLLRGSMVIGSSRFRWTGITVDDASVLAALRAFPNPDPALPFRAAACTRVVLRCAVGQIIIQREAGEKRRLLQRRSFWDALIEAAGSGLTYGGYSYRDRADHYRLEVPVALANTLRQAGELLAYTTLSNQVRSATILSADFYVARETK